MLTGMDLHIRPRDTVSDQHGLIGRIWPQRIRTRGSTWGGTPWLLPQMLLVSRARWETSSPGDRLWGTSSHFCERF